MAEAAEPEGKREEEQPSLSRPVIFREPEVQAHPSEPKVRIEQRIAVLGGEEGRELKHGAVVELPCELGELEAAANALREVERRLRDDAVFRGGYLRRWASRPQRELLRAALVRADGMKPAGH